MEFLFNSLVELITQTATNLPPDVRKAMAHVLDEEKPDTQAGQALSIIANNVDMAAAVDVVGRAVAWSCATIARAVQSCAARRQFAIIAARAVTCA